MSDEEFEQDEALLEGDGFDEIDDPEDDLDTPFSPLVHRNGIIQHEHRNVDDMPDSLELGTPSKLAAIKIYFNANDKEKSEQKIINALKLRKFMRDQEKQIEGL